MPSPSGSWRSVRHTSGSNAVSWARASASVPADRTSSPNSSRQLLEALAGVEVVFDDEDFHGATRGRVAVTVSSVPLSVPSSEPPCASNVHRARNGPRPAFGRLRVLKSISPGPPPASGTRNAKRNAVPRRRRLRVRLAGQGPARGREQRLAGRRLELVREAVREDPVLRAGRDDRQPAPLELGTRVAQRAPHERGEVHDAGLARVRAARAPSARRGAERPPPAAACRFPVRS